MRDRLRRVNRCLQESTEFAVRRCWNGTEFRRRAASTDEGTWVDGGRDLVRCWIGDRAREILDGSPPRLGRLFRKSLWLPGRHSVYVLRANGDAVLPAEALLEGFKRFRAMTGRRSPKA